MDDEQFKRVMAESNAQADSNRLHCAGGPGAVHDFALILDRVVDEASREGQMPSLRRAAARFDLAAGFNGGRSAWTFAWSTHQVQALLDLGAPLEATDAIDPSGETPALTPLGSAILRCDPEMCALLLAHGADASAPLGRFRAFELCEAEALEAFGMSEATHPPSQDETRELVRPARERFELMASTPAAARDEPRRL